MGIEVVWLQLALLTLFMRNTLQTTGSCWRRVNSDGQCQGFWRSGVSKDDCCADPMQGTHGNGWTPTNMSPSQIFYWDILERGAPNCQACRESCDGVPCGPDRRCRMRNGQPRCVCAPDCSQHRQHGHGPVCASDGSSHRNFCSLMKFNCRNSRYEWVDYNGRCKYSCRHVTCSAGKSCIMDQNAVPHCLPCSQGPCASVSDPSQHLCGVDGVTYQSSCHMLAATCRNSLPIGIAYHGPCQPGATCSSITCQSDQTCLTNHQTGQIKCERCGGTCSPAAMGAHALCGTNNVTYNNWCHLHQTACSTRSLIRTEHFGRCGQMPLEGSLYRPAYDDLDE